MRQDKPQSPNKKNGRSKENLAVMVLKGAFVCLGVALLASCFTDEGTRRIIITGMFELAKGAIFTVLGFYFAARPSDDTGS